ncbi:hypothetical protein D3C72_1706200 [compost metagenome]
MGDLQARGRALAVHRVGEHAQMRHHVAARAQLVGECHALRRHGGIGHRCHAYAARGNVAVVLHKGLRRQSLRRHALVCAGLDEAVAQSDRSDAH